MVSAMSGVTKAMKNMNNQMKLPQLQKIMQEFEMENEKNDMIQEATGDAMDDAFADDEDEEEEDRIVNEVLDQIGVDLTGSVRHLNKNHGYY
jgi:charged multivesicular body protein 2A